MASSGTTAFQPSVADFVIDAYERIGVYAPSFEAKHMISARRSTNLVMTRFSLRGVNLWKVDRDPTIFNLTADVSQYDLDSDVIGMLDTYVRTSSGVSTTDIILTPISRNDYAAIPNKDNSGRPTSYWFERTIIPRFTTWPVADDTGPYQIQTYLMRQIQDANPVGSQTTDLPYRAYYAFVAALAYDLALKFMPMLAPALKTEAAEAWQEFADEDIEGVSLFISPNFDGYG